MAILGNYVFEGLGSTFTESIDGTNSANKQGLIFSGLFTAAPVVQTYLPEQAPPPNTHKVEGRVYNYQGNPVARKVCVFSKTTDQFLGSAISDSVTGFYSIGFVSSDPVYVVCFPNENEDINAKIYDRIVPVPV